MLTIPRQIFQQKISLQQKLNLFWKWLNMRWNQALQGHAQVAKDGISFDVRKNHYQLIQYIFSGKDNLIPLLSKLVDDKGLFIDIGANIGMISLGVASASNCTVIACEPVKSTFSRLCKNLSLNTNLKIFPFNCALSQSLDLMSITNLDSSGVNQLINTEKPNLQACLSLTLDSLSQIFTTLRVSTIVIKIDVERHEVNVLQGGVGIVLQLERPIAVCFEYFSPENLDEIHQFLTRFNFLPISVDSQGKIILSECKAIDSSNALYGNSHLLKS
ncbi:FkbM family methyltransferase [Synechocystis sp. PCC 7338]|uniref:FkbM family methyltransferase n=1 Tax=Synechocystis sp. PCC 7338 TaxID=2732530 RepID=UPI001BAF65C4|nr:FkbM family methyltransferase [Synechocystis sp. PCC 7338]QUS59984.1 FkbM family methyltransferase [Synechocystis sp. PCC 7338]